MKTAIVTGITGQDGSYLSKLLLDKNYHVIGIQTPDRKSSLLGLEFLGISEKIDLRSIDLKNSKIVDQLILELKPTEFYNLAAQSSVGLSFQNPRETIEFNTLSVLNILESIRRYSPETRYYQASSSEMFGIIDQANLPLKEKELFHPASPYGISKASSHWLTVNYREAYGLESCCGILFNHESCLRGEQFVTKKIIRTALDIKAGNAQELVLGDLSIVRDWGYAPKYVEAIWLMLQQSDFMDFLICSGTNYTLETFARNVFNKLNISFENHVRQDSSLFRQLELQSIYGDNSLAKQKLGWEYDMNVEALITRLIEDEIALRTFISERS